MGHLLRHKGVSFQSQNYGGPQKEVQESILFVKDWQGTQVQSKCSQP